MVERRAMTSSRRVLSRLFTVLVLALTLAAGGCSFHHHRVGAGPQGLGEVSARQFYCLFGLFRLNEVNSQSLAGDRTAYEVVTEKGVVDWLLFPFLLPLTVTTRTVTVYR
jgi:hypothetical protein